LKSHKNSSVHKKSLERQALSSSTINRPENFEEDYFAAAQAVPLENMGNYRENLSHGPSEAEHEMWDEYIPGEGTFEMERGPKETLKDARLEFEEKVKDFGLWGGLETLPEEDISSLEDTWDEAEHDDILTEILQNIGQSNKLYR